jgi:uncharacterized protein YceK
MRISVVEADHELTKYVFECLGCGSVRHLTGLSRVEAVTYKNVCKDKDRANSATG